MEQGTRTRLATIFILFLVLVAGSVLGIAVDRKVDARNAAAQEMAGEGDDKPTEGEPTRSQREERENRRRLIVEQVGLSEAQKTEVDSIVSHYRQRMRELEDELEDELRRAYLPRYRELLEGTREEIKGVLTPAQRMQYDSLLEQYDQRRQERHNRDSDSDSRG